MLSSSDLIQRIFASKSENSATVKVGKTLGQEYIFAYFLYKQKVSRTSQSAKVGSPWRLIQKAKKIASIKRKNMVYRKRKRLCFMLGKRAKEYTGISNEFNDAESTVFLVLLPDKVNWTNKKDTRRCPIY